MSVYVSEMQGSSSRYTTGPGRVRDWNCEISEPQNYEAAH